MTYPSDSRPSLTLDHRLVPGPSLTPNPDHGPPPRLTTDADQGPQPRVIHGPGMIPTSDHRFQPSLTSDPRLTPGSDSSPHTLPAMGRESMWLTGQAGPEFLEGSQGLQAESLWDSWGQFSHLTFLYPSLPSGSQPSGCCQPGKRLHGQAPGEGKNWLDQPTPLFAQVWVKIASALQASLTSFLSWILPRPKSLASCSCP